MKIHLLGDSIVQHITAEGRGFYRGWGDYLPLFLKSDVEVRNYARGGRSSRSFLNEGRFLDTGRFTEQDPPYGMGPAYPHIEAGDYVFIQFMHNDDDSATASYRVNKQVLLGNPDEQGIYPTVKPEESMKVSIEYWIPGYPDCLYAEGKTEAEVKEILKTAQELLEECGESYYPYDCGATYKGYLKYYIDKIREKGAVPILITAPVRWCFENEILIPVPGHHGGKNAYHEYPYVEAVRQLAGECGVQLLDLFGETKELYERIGSEASSYLHNIAIATGASAYDSCKNWCEEYDLRRAKNDYQKFDAVHANRFGACLQAGLLTKLLKKQGILNDVLKEQGEQWEEVPERLRSVFTEEVLSKI